MDLLAISVGTSHGEYELQDEIDYGLIKEVRGITEVPLVMHGTYGVPLTHITKVVTAGVRKTNFGEAFRINYIKFSEKYRKGMPGL